MKASVGLISPEGVFHDCRWLSPHCAFAWTFLGVCVSLGSLSLIIRPPLSYQGPPLGSHLPLIISLKALFSNTVTLGSRALTYTFVVDGRGHNSVCNRDSEINEKFPS